MADLSLAVVFTRPELGLADLAVQDPANGYEVASIGPGSRSWRRETVKNQYVHGETQVTAVLDAQQWPVTIRVSGATLAQANARLDALIDAVSQFAYYSGVIIDGEGWIWACGPADLSVGESGEFSKFHLMAKIFEVTMTIPRNPVPFSGTI